MAVSFFLPEKDRVYALLRSSHDDAQTLVTIILAHSVVAIARIDRKYRNICESHYFSSIVDSLIHDNVTKMYYSVSKDIDSRQSIRSNYYFEINTALVKNFSFFFPTEE